MFPFDPVTAGVIAALAEEVGYTAEINDSPEAVIERLRSGEKICMLAVYHVLPGMSAAQFLEAIRRQGIQAPVFTYVPVWRPDSPEGNLFARAGFTKVLHMPTSAETIVEILEQHLQQDCCP